MINPCRTFTALLLILGGLFPATGEEGHKTDRYPTKLAPENRAAYGVLLDQLDANSARLREVFKSGDQQREAELYAVREKILVACQSLMPSSDEEPSIEEGIVESKYGERLGLRIMETRGISLSVGHIAAPELRQQYEAIQIGDKIRLVFTKQPSIYNNDQYDYQLEEIKRIGTGIQNFDIQAQSKEKDFEDTTVMVLHPDAASDSVVILATIKNNKNFAIDFANDKQYFLKVEVNHKVEVHYSIKHQTPVIEPGGVGVILLEVLKKDFQGRHLRVQAGTQTGSLLNADIEVKR